MGEVLEWDIRVPLVSNVYVLVDLLLVLFLVSAALAWAVLYASGFSDVVGVLRLIIVADALIVVALFMVMGYIFTNQFQLYYRLDSMSVLVRVGEFDGSLNKLAWRVSSLIQRLGFMGGRVYVLSDKEQSISWSSVFRAVYDERRRVISLNSESRTLMRIYCTPENVDQVFSMVHVLVPEAEDSLG